MKKSLHTFKRNAITLIGTLVLMFGPTQASAQASAQTSIAAQPVGKAQIQQSQQLKQLQSDYYLANVRFNPIGATFSGDNRFDDQLGMAIAPKQRAQQLARYRSFAKRLQAIDSAKLSRTDRISHEILDYELATAFSFAPFPDHFLPIDQMGSMPVVLANFASGKGSQPLITPKQYRAYLSRLNQLSAWIDQAIVNMREGMKTGVVLPRALVVSMLPQYQKLVSATPEASVFYTPVKNLPTGFSAADQTALTASYRNEIDKRLNPALGRLASFLEKDYLPAARSSAGWGALPKGADWYAASVAASTTTSLKPDQIHAIGQKEVLRIQQQFAELGPKMGYTGPAADLPKWVAAQDKYRPFKSEQEINDIYRKLNETLTTKLPSLFTLIPKAPLEVRAEPELTRATASDNYSSPSDDGSRPGIFWSVVNDPTQYPKVKMTTLFLHEASPGHHFQIALQLEQKLPEFRKFGGNNAYTEGWALYAETLGKELGLYEEPDQYFGHLNFELLRAARLVVDTGLHAQGWTREQAIAYLRETLGETEEGAKSAIERYMAWPAQALAYKVGSMKIMELRQRGAAALGAKFSLPAFHAVVLDEGSLPLAVLEAKVDRWIAESK
jgi:uncharacterized protein (DUF885 family)